MGLVKQILITLTKVSNLYPSSTRKCNSSWDQRRSQLKLMSSAKTRKDSNQLLPRPRNGQKHIHHLRRFPMSWFHNHSIIKISKGMISRALYVTKEHVVAAIQLVLSRWLRVDKCSSTETRCQSCPCNFCFNVIIWTKVAMEDGLFSMGI